MSVTVLSLPEREANSAASFSDSRRCSSSRAWWMQKEGWPFLRSMRQVRPSELRCKLRQTECKKKDPDVKSTSGAPGPRPTKKGHIRASVIGSLFMKAKNAREAARREKLLRFLESDTSAWRDVDHPELGRGAAACVRALRQESEKKVLSVDELEDDLEMQEPELKAQIRSSSEDYRRGQKRDARTFLSELRRKPARPKRRK